MNTAISSETTLGQVSNQERVMRTVIGLGTIVAVLEGAIGSEGHMFVAAILCVYMCMTAVMGLDPFYFVAEKMKRTHEKSPETAPVSRRESQAVRIVSNQSRSAA